MGAVIRSLHSSSSGDINRGLVGSPNSHPCLAVTRSPTLPRCQRRPSGEIGLLLPSNSNKAVSPFSCWSSVTGSLLKDKSRCLRLWGLNKKKEKNTPHPKNQEDLNLYEERQSRGANTETNQIWQLSGKDFKLAIIEMLQQVILSMLETNRKSYQRNKRYKVQPSGILVANRLFEIKDIK